MSVPLLDVGDGLELRRYELSDAEMLFACVERNRERLAPWMPWVAATTAVEHERAWLEQVLADPHGLAGCGLWLDRRFAGGLGLTEDPFGVHGELGYWIEGELEGRGVITRGCRAIIDLGFAERGLHRMVIRAGVENRRSRAVPERLGFTMEGVARGEGRGSAGYYDLAVYGLLEDEWPPA